MNFDFYIKLLSVTLICIVWKLDSSFSVYGMCNKTVYASIMMPLHIENVPSTIFKNKFYLLFVLPKGVYPLPWWRLVIVFHQFEMPCMKKISHAWLNNGKNSSLFTIQMLYMYEWFYLYVVIVIKWLNIHFLEVVNHQENTTWTLH